MTPRAAALALTTLATALLPTARAASGQDWAEYLGGPDRGHYSSLDQINTSNVATLKMAWEFHTGDFGQMQCNPIIVHGVLYGATGTSQIFAVDAATGRSLWRFRGPDVAEPTLANDRGVTYWTDGRSERILCTVDSWLYALDTATGKVIEDFGNHGRASLKAGLGPQAQDKWVASTTPGTVFGDLIVMPTRVGEDQDAAPGWIQAFNVRTGTLAWVFVTIPFPGDPGYETWSKDTYRNIDVGSANCWAGMAIDRARGILYVPDGLGGARLLGRPPAGQGPLCELPPGP
jgi:quinoprotein glucose dehydrogenase